MNVEDLMCETLQGLAGLDLSDVNLRDHPGAYLILDKFLGKVTEMAVEAERDRCIAKIWSACEKCDGAGWLWSHELDHANEATRADTMTRYPCDSELCRAAHSLLFDDKED